MVDVAVVGFAQSPCVRHGETTTSGVEMLVPIFHEVLASTGLARTDVGFWCSGSSDYLAGRAFSFVAAVDAIGAFPPVMESHVEMDGAWALYEAWVKILTGAADIALAYGFGKSSAGDLRRVLALQLDPYLLAPLWPDSVSIAALQARPAWTRGCGPRRTWRRSRRAAGRRRGPTRRPRSPARCAPRTCWPSRTSRTRSGRTTARRWATVPPWPSWRPRSGPATCAPGPRGSPVSSTGSTPRALGERDLTTVPSAAAAGRAAGAGQAEVAELHAPFTHQEILLRTALGLGDGVRVNPSGGALAGNPMFAAGLARIGMAAREIFAGRADRALGHATSGPALQQNLVCVMEARA